MQAVPVIGIVVFGNARIFLGRIVLHHGLRFSDEERRTCRAARQGSSSWKAFVTGGFQADFGSVAAWLVTLGTNR